MSREEAFRFMDSVSYFPHLVSNSDMEQIIHYLISISECVTDIHQNMKFKKNTTTAIEPISQTEQGIISMKRTIQSLNLQVNEIEINIRKIDTEIRSLLQNGNKSRALTKLKHKKELLNICDKREHSLDTITEIMMKIQNAESQIDVNFSSEFSKFRL